MKNSEALLREEQEALSKLPVEKIRRKTFESLPEYSCSMPTGVFPGKVWKRDLRFGLHGKDTKPVWVLCEYVSSGPEHCRTEFRRPLIIEDTGEPT